MVPYEFTLLLLCCAATVKSMDVEYSWVYVDYTFSSPSYRDSAIKSGKFIQENCVILDVDVYQDDSEEKLYFNSGSTSHSVAKRVFVTVPRIKPGNPASLAEVVPGERPNSVLLAPYPSWKANTMSEDRLNCDDAIISVFRTKIDNIGRFWAVDVGGVDQFEMTARSLCPPKLLIFDLKNGDKVIRSYKFPSSQVRDISLFTNIVVDMRDSKGRNAFAYISDTTAYKLIVYDYKNDDSWVIDQAYFYPYPNKAKFNVNGVSFALMDGVLGLALGPVTKNERKLYFHSFASTRESWVFTSVLQNKSLFENGLVDGSGTFFVSPEVRSTQSSVEVMTNDGILFSAMMDNSLVCWNCQDQFISKNIYTVYKNDEEFQFATGIKIVGDKVWAVSCQLQNQLGGVSVNRKAVKYRVLNGRIDELIKDTGCDKRITFDGNDDEDEFLVEPPGGINNNVVSPFGGINNNVVSPPDSWRAAPNTPWSYSRISRVYEAKSAGKRSPGKSLMVIEGNVNLHGDSSKSASLPHDFLSKAGDGRFANGQTRARGKTRSRWNGSKRTPGPFR